jgi:DNA-binding transcriptional LysR family regulator
MELDQLRGLVEIARERSFTRAAEKLFLSQPAVSLQIKALEREVGQRLFERHGKRVTITNAGRLLYNRAEQILALVDRASEDLSGLGALNTGHLSIGTSDTNCTYVLPPSVRAFRARYPGVDIRLTDRMSPEVVRLVVEGTVDFGIATMPVGHTGVLTSHLFERKDVVIARPDHPLGDKRDMRLPDLAEDDWLMLEPGSTSRGLVDQAMLDEGMRPTVVMELGSIEVIKKFVGIGLGIALVPEVAVGRELADGDLRRLDVGGIPLRQVSLILRPGGYLSPAADAFLGIFKKDVVVR